MKKIRSTESLRNELDSILKRKTTFESDIITNKRIEILNGLIKMKERMSDNSISLRIEKLEHEISVLNSRYESFADQNPQINPSKRYSEYCKIVGITRLKASLKAVMNIVE